MRKFFAFMFLILPLFAQAQKPDTNRVDTSSFLDEIKVNAYFTYQPLINAPFTVNTVDSALIHGNHNMSLLPALNLGPGIRMEERSPGSYRLSIRGSLLRSPFGVRNVKVYLDEFAFTDASGNTYLNMIDIANINRMEILRGPDASLFGANTGGVLRLLPFDIGRDTNFVQVGFSAGAYGLLRQNAQMRKKTGRHVLMVSQNLQRSNGYRQNSSMARNGFMLSDEWHYSPKAKIKLLGMFTQLDYLTPGGLTLEQYTQDPRQARAPTAFAPGAVEQKAGVYNKTLFTGLSHQTDIGRHWRHLVSVFGSGTDFKNPFITNYEIRKEQNAGMRTWVEYYTERTSKFRLNVYLGFEGQQGSYSIRNYGNNGGQRDTLQSSDDFTTQYAFGFARVNADYLRKFSLELSVSNNYSRYFFTEHFPNPTTKNKRIFAPQLMPRAAFSWRFIPVLSWRLIASKGYSPPTLAEIRPSGQPVNTSLKPEQGWNYETGLRFRSPNTRAYVDVAGFHFALNEAIVRRVDENGNEFFVNAGGTKQMGIEVQFDLMLWDRTKGFLRKFKFCRSYTFSYFKFSEYSDGENDFTGNFVTGVPQHVVITGAEVEFAQRIGLFVQYQFTSKIPLNDAGTVKLNRSHLVQAKLSWTKPLKKAKLGLFFGVDNLLNQLYSLGSDLNAFGGRYYNPAPGRNFYGGLSVVF